MFVGAIVFYTVCDPNCIVVIRCRYGCCELHIVASFLAGIAAQEIIKIVTKQYIPMSNTLVYNGIRGTTSVYEL